MWTIDKQFDFCYAHRVWSQKLQTEFCAQDDSDCKCRFLHGHQAKVHVFVGADELSSGMVTDFKHLGFLKDFLNTYIDHKFILDLNDPWFINIINAKPIFCENGLLQCLSATQPLNTKDGRELKALPVVIPGTNCLMGYRLIVDDLKGPEKEFFEGFFLVDFLPTSENLSKWIADGCTAKLSGLGVNVLQVEWFETPKSRSTYSNIL